MTREIRQNKLTGQWVIYAPDRSHRPSQFDREPATSKQQPSYDNQCPFCPGNETMLPGITLETTDNDSELWRTRVVPNKYPVLSSDQGQERHHHEMYVSMPGFGHHEVIIEHPRHDLDLADMTFEALAPVIETYHRRYTDLMQQNENMMVIIFRNHGQRAGTSLRHPHSQLVATGVVPNHVRWREDRAQYYYDTWGRSLMGDIMATEKRIGERIVDENALFIAFVPYSAEVPYEIWIVPKRQQAEFGSINDAEKKALTQILGDSLRRLCKTVDNPDYNYIIHTAPRYKAGEPHLHWYLQIRPRLITPAGFEIGSGMIVNPSLPETDAKALRKA